MRRCGSSVYEEEFEYSNSTSTLALASYTLAGFPTILKANTAIASLKTFDQSLQSTIQ